MITKVEKLNECQSLLTDPNAGEVLARFRNPPSNLTLNHGLASCVSSPVRNTLTALHPEMNERYGWNDIGNGNLFADWYRDKARYASERKKWFIYDGRRWVLDPENLKVMELCKKLANALRTYVKSLPDECMQRQYMEHVQRWQQRRYRETILKDATGVYPVQVCEFDKNPYLLNCLNGTLDLQTGELHNHMPEDLLSKLANVRYDSKSRCERWERYIDEVMEKDTDKACFLQKALGYTLTGDTRHECFFILYGPSSRNGKGTCMETIARIMGDYGRSANPESITQKQVANGSGPSEDIARLAGARFVNISEPDKKMILSTALVKTLTGNDTITARFLHENSFEYRPQFKIFVNTNHLPSVTDVTLFSSGRVKIIPFEHHFSEAERDEGLKNELSKPENLSGILNWCMEGLRMIEETGFDAPKAVRDATEEYRMNSDKIGRFLSDALEAYSDGQVQTIAAYGAYQEWCRTNGYCPENMANFKSMLANQVRIERKRIPDCGKNPVSSLMGYRLKPEFLTKANSIDWN